MLKILGASLLILLNGEIRSAPLSVVTVTPEMYGARGDGVTNDRAAVGNAFEAVRAAGGGRIEFSAGRKYNLGNLAKPDEVAIDVSGLTNATVHGNDAELFVNTTAKVATQILRLTGPKNVRISHLHFRDVGLDLTVNWKGAAALDLLGADVESGPVMLDRCAGESLLYLVGCHSARTAPIRGISLSHCRIANSYYGINCRNNGYGLRATDFRADNVRRPYFVYGVEDHDVELSIHHDGHAAGSSAACIVGNLGQRDTRDVRLKVRFTGDTSKYLTGLNIEHQRPAGDGGLIRDVDALLNVEAPSAMIPVRFRSYRVNAEGKLVEEDRTSNRIREVRLSGKLATTGPESIAVGLLTQQGVTVATPSGVAGRLFLDQELVYKPSASLHFPGFVVSRDDASE